MKLKYYIISASTIIAAIGLYQIIPNAKIYTPRILSKLDSEKRENYEKNEEEEIKGAVEEIYTLRNNQVTGTIDYADFAAAQSATFNASLRRTSKDLTWLELGPDNVGGRTRSIIIDKRDPNIMYTGGVSGGIFRSTTRGTSWKPVGNQLLNLNVSNITQDFSNNIYYGTGEGGFVSVLGDKNGTPGFIGGGVYASTDGISYSLLPSTNPTINSQWTNVHKLAADPNSDVIYAANDGGFFFSENKGINWTRTPGQLGSCREIEVSKSGAVYMNFGPSIWKSTDKGKTIAKTGYNTSGTSPQISVGRVTIAVSPQDENYIYALASGTNNLLSGLMRSTNGGANWEMLLAGSGTSTPNSSEIFGTNGQGNYDNTITVDPLNKNRVILGGVDLAEWNSGSFNIIASKFAARTSNSYVHSDKHDLVWDNSVNPPILWIGCDGGIFRSANMYADGFDYKFSAQNRGFSTIQFYGLAAAEDGTIIGGTQDNSNQLINGKGNTPKSSVTLYGGDGFQTEISRKDPLIIFVESQYGNLGRSTNGGVAFDDIWDKRIGNSDAEVVTNENYAPFDCQFRLWEHPTDSAKSKLFFAPYGRIWAAVNPINPAGRPIWFNISTSNGNNRVIDLEPSANGNNLFFTTRSSGIFRIDSLNTARFDTTLYPISGGMGQAIPTPIRTVNINGNLPLGGRAVTSFNIDPNNPNRAIVTLGNFGNTAYIFICNNILDDNPTYINITGTLPRMPVYDALILIDNPNYFIVATEMGIWASDDNGASWELQSNGIPSVASYILRQYEFKSWEGPRIYVGTHGRGFYRSNSFLTSVKQVASISDVALIAFPNPVTDKVNIKFNVQKAGMVTYTVYNLQGQQLKKEVEMASEGNFEKQINLSHLAPGTYIISLNSGSFKKAIKVLVQ